MTSEVSFPISPSQTEGTTGKYVITFQDDATTEGLAISNSHFEKNKVLTPILEFKM